MELPWSLRAWFVADFVVGVVVGLPVLVSPAYVLGHFGWTTIDPVAARLAAAALLAIGLQSFFGLNDGIETYRAMLRLKVIWSMAAVIGLLAAIADGGPPATWALLAVFLVYLGVWSHHAIRLKQMAGAPADGAEPAEAADDSSDGAPDPGDQR
ncbi:MAG TPA: hypothetical protein VH374_17720 [Polyangia bacterium]|nr:hypothetical protein [Polyangia bacterium]